MFDLIVVFAASSDVLTRRVPGLAQRIKPAGGLWIAWRKKSSRVQTDVTEPLVRSAGLATGLVDNKICAIDQIWSGLRFVVRVRDRG